MRLFLRFLLPLILLFSTRALAQGRVDCNALNSRILSEVVHYCALLPESYDSGKEPARHYAVLYFLHGLGENEQMLFRTGGWTLIGDLRQQRKLGDFLIVTPEAKRTFYVNSADGKVRYSDFFLREFIPYIEARYRVRHDRGARAIGGISMGGYGALRFAFSHPELFVAVSAQSAALITDSPQELNRGMRSGTPLSSVLGKVFGDPINVPNWRENDPLVLARKNKTGISKLAIYFNCGREDDYGFETGALALHKELESEGIRHEFHLYPGNHDAIYFLAHLEEQLEFHGRAFR